MKKIVSLSIILITSLTLAACGITEELEQAKEAVNNLKTTLTTQGQQYEELIANISEMPEAFAADLEVEPETGLFPEETGDVYRVISTRQELLATMTETNKEVTKLKKELQRIIKKDGADVDNKQLSLINQSLDIVISNFTSLEVYHATSEQQETDFFGDLPSDGLNGQFSIISRTYGSIEIVSEEALANLEYSLALIDTFEKQAPESKAKKR